MATASELDNIIGTVRTLFESTRLDLGIAQSSNAVQIVFSTATSAVIKPFLLDLVLALQTQRTSRILRSRIGDRTLAGDLASLYNRIDSNQFDILSAIPLVEQIVNKNPTSPTGNDANIWSAVFELVARTTPISSPTTFAKAVFDTPLRPNSASQSGIEQTHDEVDQRILEELTGRVYYDVQGFYERYFEGKSWTNHARHIFEESKTQYVQGRWSEWPEPSLQRPFFEWFIKFQDTILSGLHRRYYTSANKVLRGSEADRKLDIFLTYADVALPNGEHDWSNVLVIGEHKQNPDEDRSAKTLVQLAGYAREVFGSQPERRFIPGFTICGSIMRLWVFDRSGPYNSEKFDINKEPEQFIRVIAGYALMTDVELGLNTFIKRDGTGKYILAQDERISLEDKPIASTKAIVCRGTLCYRGRRPGSTDWEYVVKFAWPSNKRQREGELLKLAKERGVTGIAMWFNHEQITIDGHPDTISHFRREMIFGTPRRLSSKASWVDSSPKASRVYSKVSCEKSNSATHLTSLGSGGSRKTGQKRKRGESLDVARTSRVMSPESDGTHTGATTVRPKEGESDAKAAHSVQEKVVDSLANGRNEWQFCADTDSLTECESGIYDNRVHYCLVTSPAGRPLCSCQSVRELLEALRDAIRGHRSLLEDGRILHRDISENNIIITDSFVEGAPKGRLIDLDLAKELGSVPGGARHRTGTMQFMAIQVLEGNGHTYRHDLESFFYVFIWMCVRYGHDKLMKPRKNILRGWYTGTYTEIATIKQGHVVKNRFESVVAEFGPKFENLKPLARELRSVLFPIRDGDIFTGTFHDHHIMYDGIIHAFSRAIGRLSEVEQSTV